MVQLSFTLIPSCGNAENVRFIAREFANKDVLTKQDYSNQDTALHLAAQNGHAEVVEVLLDAARCLPNTSDYFDKPVTLSLKLLLGKSNYYTITALHIAVSNDHVDIVKLLVEADPSDAHVLSHNSETSIYISAKLGYSNIVKMICTICTAPSLDGPSGTTVFHAVIQKLHQGKSSGRG